MKYILTILLALFCFVNNVRADTASDLVGLGMSPELAEYVAGMSTVLSNAEWITATDYAGTGTLSLLKGGTDDDTYLNGDSGDLIKLTIAKTPVAAIGAPTPAAAFTPGAAGDLILNGELIALDKLTGTDLSITSVSTDLPFAAGKMPKLAAVVFTPSTSFPTPAAADVSYGINIIATAAPTTAYGPLPAATANVGKTYEFYNRGANPLAIVAQNSDTINAITANTPYPCQPKRNCRCTGITTSNYQCKDELDYNAAIALGSTLSVSGTSSLAQANLTGDAVFSAAKGQQLVPAVFTISAAFPTPGVADLSSRIAVVATAAPTAVYIPMPAATANVGKTYVIYNKGASPANITAQNSDVINALVANTPFACAAGKICTCHGIDSGSYACGAQ